MPGPRPGSELWGPIPNVTCRPGPFGTFPTAPEDPWSQHPQPASHRVKGKSLAWQPSTSPESGEEGGLQTAESWKAGAGGQTRCRAGTPRRTGGKRQGAGPGPPGAGWRRLTAGYVISGFPSTNDTRSSAGIAVLSLVADTPSGEGVRALRVPPD